MSKNIQKKVSSDKNIPKNLQMWNFFQASYDILLHLVDIRCFWGASVTVFCSSPILLNKIQFTMALWVEITYVTTRGNEFFEMRLLGNKIGLREKKAAAATVRFASHTLESFALSIKSIFWPKSL